jgi:hypothetical protein
MSKKGKHHYIPVFYLKQWSGADERVCEYKQRYRGVLPKRVYPDATGYVHGLYNVPGLPSEDIQYVEKKFMQAVDGRASAALRAMLDDNITGADFAAPLKTAWAQFLYSLTFRTPNVIERMQGRIEREEVGQGMTPPAVPYAAPEMFPNLLASKLVIPGLLSMHWNVGSVKGAKNLLLTSDKPIIMTNGFSDADAHIALPISPTAFFIATRTMDMFRQIASRSRNDLASTINNKVSEQSIDFVYAFDDKQTRFIQNRFGRCVRSTPLDPI